MGKKRKDPVTTIMVSNEPKKASKRAHLELTEMESKLSSLIEPDAVSKDIQDQVKNKHKEAIQQVDHFYPVYSDVKGAWQADTMFIPYKTDNTWKTHGFFVLININTKVAFVHQAPFTPSKKDAKWLPKQAQKHIKVHGSATDSTKAKNALASILSKDIPREQKFLQE